MSDTLGSLVDKLITVKLKIANNKIQVPDLERQRDLLLSEIEELVSSVSSKLADGSLVQEKHKTY
jgi:hypothetical protein